ncbi:MAG: class I SAM-dependent methyltransferase [Cyanobacteriota/Melainabacteria group bacterium]
MSDRFNTKAPTGNHQNTNQPNPAREADTSVCFWCGASHRQKVTDRKDGIAICSCSTCGSKAVAKITFDLNSLYDESDYFEGNSEFGYDNYDTTGIEHWTENLFAVLMLGEDLGEHRVLDVGCATGNFLDQCKSFELNTSGIELSTWAREICISKGHHMVGGEIAELRPEESFDVITAFHVLEHLESPKKFLETIATRTATGSRFFATFPNVDFSSANWSGFDSSYEHISYFEPDFVAKKFPDIFDGQFYFIPGQGQIYCFAGRFTRSIEDALELSKSIALQEEIQDTDNELASRAEGLSRYGLLFLITFVARNHSAVKASRVLDVLESRLLEKMGEDWLNLCRALIHLQNGNVYGAASGIGRISDQETALQNLRESIRARLKMVASTADYPKITVVLSCCHATMPKEQFFHSIGSQTYPNIEILHVGDKASCRCEMPALYKELVTYMQPSEKQNLKTVLDEAEGELILWTDGSYILSPFCLFSLYHILCDDPKKVVIPQTKRSETAAADHYPGKRTIEKFLGTRFRTIPPLLFFHKKDNPISNQQEVSADSIGCAISLKSLLKGARAKISQDSLAWRT